MVHPPETGTRAGSQNSTAASPSAVAIYVAGAICAAVANCVARAICVAGTISGGEAVSGGVDILGAEAISGGGAKYVHRLVRRGPVWRRGERRVGGKVGTRANRCGRRQAQKVGQKRL